MRLRGPARCLLIATSSVALGSCFLVSDVDRFHATGGGGADQVDDPGAPSTLELTLNGMRPHLDQMIEFRVMNDQGYIQCRGIIDPIDEPSVDTVSFHIQNAIPAGGSFHLDFFGDVNGSGDYDGLPTENDLLRDHAWRIDPLADFPPDTFRHLANVVQVTFQHNVDFTDIGQANTNGADIVIRFPEGSLKGYEGRLLETKIAVSSGSSSSTSRTVGLYRNPEIPAAAFEAVIPGMAEPGETYDIDVYVDANGDGRYDNPEHGGDRGWRFSATADIGGGGSGGGGGSAAQGGAGGTGGGPSGGAGPQGSIGIDLLFDSGAQSDIDVGPP